MNIYLEQYEEYTAITPNLFVFCKGTDVVRNFPMTLGNMLNGFEFEIEGLKFLNSEQAYIMGAYSNNTEEHRHIQQLVLDSKNGMMVKRTVNKPNRNKQRTDRKDFRVQWMLYVVWKKCIGNNDFSRLLLSFPKDCTFVENSTFQTSTTSDFWGCKNIDLRKVMLKEGKILKSKFCDSQAKRILYEKRLNEFYTIGVYSGKNIMGKILMICKKALEDGTEPPIDYELLRSKRIYLLGKEIYF